MPAAAPRPASPFVQFEYCHGRNSPCGPPVGQEPNVQPWTWVHVPRSAQTPPDRPVDSEAVLSVSQNRRSIMTKERKQLDELFHDTLKDIYFAEKKILATLPRWRRLHNLPI